MSDDEHESLCRDAYRVRADASAGVTAEVVPGSTSPLKISMGLRDHVSLERSIGKSVTGTILHVDMTAESAKALYVQLARALTAAGCRLPVAPEFSGTGFQTQVIR